MLPDPPLHRKLIRHYEGGGESRSLTFSCYQRQPFFSRERCCHWMIQALQLGRERHPVHYWAFVVMPEHVHLLLWPTATSFKAAAFLSTIKQSVAKRARLHLLRHNSARLQEAAFHFWQDGPGYDRNLVDERSIWQEIDYIHENPVRRGLCERPENWRWSSAAQFCGLSDLDLLMDLSSLPPDLRTR